MFMGCNPGFYRAIGRFNHPAVRLKHLWPTTQENRLIAIETPFGKDALLLQGFTGREGISRLFSFHLDLLSEKESIDFKNIVGQNVTIQISSCCRGHTLYQWFRQPICTKRLRPGRHPLPDGSSPLAVVPYPDC